jgi:ribonucleoside-diphosphate reductase subunit M2
MTESPAKKLSFEAMGKENVQTGSADLDDFELKKLATEVIKTEEKVPVAPTIKPEEADEPLLRENPHRFVLFPIKYHEVSLLPTRHA